MKNIFLLAISISSLISCSIPNTVVVELESKNSSNVIGNAVFTEFDNIVTMVADIKNLKPGQHAIHLHEKSDCSSDDGKSTGGHWNPTLTQSWEMGR